MLSLPLFGTLVMWKLSFLPAKGRRMHRPASVHALTRNELVQHFMEDDAGHHVLRDKRLVQEATDADQPTAVVIRTKPNGGTRPLQRPTHPGNASLDTIGKIGMVQLTIDRYQVMVATLSL